MEMATKREGVTPGFLNLADSVVDEEALQKLSNLTKDSFDYEEILKITLRNLYGTRPIGEENYFGERPRIGSIQLDRCFEAGFAQLGLYIRIGGGWRNEEIAAINLRERTYAIPKHGGLSSVLVEDTNEVMKILGLKKVEHSGKVLHTKYW